MRPSEVILMGIITACPMLMGGCTMAQVHHKTEKTECRASYTSVMKDVYDIEMRACHASGSAGSSTEALSKILADIITRGLTR